MRTQKDGYTGSGRVNAPHYWAHFYHGARGVIRAIEAAQLIWFKKGHRDPRHPGGRYPKSRSQLRRLTTAQYRKARKNKTAVFSETSPTSGSPKWPGNPFFGNGPGEGMSGLKKDAASIAREEASRSVKTMLASLPKEITRNVRVG